MERSLEDAAAERRDYVEQVRASFYEPEVEKGGMSYRYGELQETGVLVSGTGFGARLVIAVLLFAAFVYCDQKEITFHSYGTADVVAQMEWEAVPMERIVEMVMAQPH